MPWSHPSVCALQVKRSFGLCSLQLTYFDEENEEVRVSLWFYLLTPLFLHFAFLNTLDIRMVVKVLLNLAFNLIVCFE